MIQLVLALSLLGVLALIYLLRPLLDNKQDEKSVDADANQLAIFHEQQKQLDGQLKSGELDQAEYHVVLDELKLKLLKDMESAQNEESESLSINKISWVAMLAVALLILTSTALVYQNVGQPDISGRIIDLQEMSKDPSGFEDFARTAFEEADQKKIQDIILIQQLKVLEDRESHEEWYTLARIYLQIGQPQMASAVYEASLKEHPGEQSLKVGLSEAYLSDGNSETTPKAQTLLNEVLQSNPAHQGAMMLLAFSHYNQGQYRPAIDLWTRLRAMLKPESESYSLLTNTINTAEERLKALETEVEYPWNIRISLDVKQLNINSPEARVYVIARALNGPPMPLAVKSYAIDGVPEDITLKYTDRMMGGPSLGSQQNIELSAKVSLTGSATPSDSDIKSQTVILDYNEFNAEQVVTLEWRP